MEERIERLNWYSKYNTLTPQFLFSVLIKRELFTESMTSLQFFNRFFVAFLPMVINCK